MKNLSILFFITLIAASCGQKANNETEQAESKEVTSTPAQPDGVNFIFPKDGETVSSPVMVGFGINGMEVEPAGQVNEGMGHHHIIVDGAFIAEGTMVPADSTHFHYGKGQLETKLDIAPGKHTLTMQFADGVHKSYGESWSKTIEIIVTENN
jgi:hypothetical protein